MGVSSTAGGIIAALDEGVVHVDLRNIIEVPVEKL
jgi:hypothetical protein